MHIRRTKESNSVLLRKNHLLPTRRDKHTVHQVIKKMVTANKVTKTVETAEPASMTLREVMPPGIEEALTKVGGKKTATRKRKIRPDLIIISKKGNMSFADFLREVKSDPKLINLDRIRRPHKDI